jgi:hypothetical protein
MAVLQTMVAAAGLLLIASAWEPVKDEPYLELLSQRYLNKGEAAVESWVSLEFANASHLDIVTLKSGVVVVATTASAVYLVDIATQKQTVAITAAVDRAVVVPPTSAGDTFDLLIVTTSKLETLSCTVVRLPFAFFMSLLSLLEAGQLPSRQNHHCQLRVC